MGKKINLYVVMILANFLAKLLVLFFVESAIAEAQTDWFGLCLVYKIIRNVCETTINVDGINLCYVLLYNLTLGRHCAGLDEGKQSYGYRK